MKYMEFWYHNIKNSSYELLQIDGLQLNIWVKSCLDLILIKMCKPLLRCHLYLTICVPSLFYTLLHSTTRILKFWLHDILCFCHVLSNKWGVFRVAPMSCFWMLHEKLERSLGCFVHDEALEGQPLVKVPDSLHRVLQIKYIFKQISCMWPTRRVKVPWRKYNVFYLALHLPNWIKMT